MCNRFVFFLLQKRTNHKLLLEILGTLLKRMLVKYWIYFCAAMFLILSFNGSVVACEILCTVLFQFCVAQYQISRKVKSVVSFSAGFHME